MPMSGRCVGAADVTADVAADVADVRILQGARYVNHTLSFFHFCVPQGLPFYLISFLKDAPTLAIGGVDTEENEPSKVW